MRINRYLALCGLGSRRAVEELVRAGEVIELRYFADLSYEEIATMSNRSVSTIKASVFFALEKLRKLVKEPLKPGGEVKLQ